MSITAEVMLLIAGFVVGLCLGKQGAGWWALMLSYGILTGQIKL